MTRQCSFKVTYHRRSVVDRLVQKCDKYRPKARERKGIVALFYSCFLFWVDVKEHNSSAEVPTTCGILTFQSWNWISDLLLWIHLFQDNLAPFWTGTVAHSVLVTGMRLHGFSVSDEHLPGTVGSCFVQFARVKYILKSFFYLNIDALFLKIRFKMRAILSRVSQRALWLRLISSTSL